MFNLYLQTLGESALDSHLKNSQPETPLGSRKERSTGGRGFEGFLGEARPCHGAQVSRQTPGGWVGFYRKMMSKCHY